MADVHLPTALLALFPQLPRQLEVEAGTVDEAIARLEERWPGVRDRLVEAGPSIRPHINVYVDRERAGLDTPVDARSRIDVIAAISGGSGHDDERGDYAVARLDEIDELNDGREPWRPVRHHLGITAFGVNAWTGHDVGDRIINEHDEDEPDGAEELYVVLQGRAVFELDGDRVDAPAGTLVFARPGVKRTAFAEEPETTIIAVGGTPGQVYEANGWELWATLRPLYEAGEYAEAADRGRALVEANPQYATVFYNVACCESLAGRTANALDHLRRAIDMSERFRALAKDDSDFDPIRDEPAFKELIGVS